MSASAPSGHRPRQILLVDNEKSVVEAYREALEDHFPYDRVETAANGFDAVEAFRLRRHDVMVMDIHMPVMDGQQAEYEIRMFCEEKNIPEPDIIFFTGYLPPDSMKETIRMNPACSLLLKPVTAKTLIEEIEKKLTARAETEADA